MRRSRPAYQPLTSPRACTPRRPCSPRCCDAAAPVKGPPSTSPCSMPRSNGWDTPSTHRCTPVASRRVWASATAPSPPTTPIRPPTVKYSSACRTIGAGVHWSPTSSKRRNWPTIHDSTPTSHVSEIATNATLSSPRTPCAGRRLTSMAAWRQREFPPHRSSISTRSSITRSCVSAIAGAPSAPNTPRPWRCCRRLPSPTWRRACVTCPRSANTLTRYSSNPAWTRTPPMTPSRNELPTRPASSSPCHAERTFNAYRTHRRHNRRRSRHRTCDRAQIRRPRRPNRHWRPGRDQGYGSRRLAERRRDRRRVRRRFRGGRGGSARRRDGGIPDGERHGEQRGHHPRRHHAKNDGATVRRRHHRPSSRLLERNPTGRSDHAGERRRIDHRHVVDLGQGRLRRADQLFGGEGWHCRTVQGGRQRSGAPGRPCQRDPAGIDPYGHDRGHAAKRLGTETRRSSHATGRRAGRDRLSGTVLRLRLVVLYDWDRGRSDRWPLHVMQESVTSGLAVERTGGGRRVGRFMAPSLAIDIHVGCSEPAAPLSRRDALRSSVYGQARRLGFRTMPAHSRTVTEPSREIDVIHETDVLVVGSGPGGLAAALAASRAGVRVALVE